MKSFRQIGLLLFLVCFVIQISFSQDVLTLEEAIQTGLENNYNIRISRNNEAIAANSNTYGNAGFLPRLNTTTSLSYSSSNTVQKLFSGDERIGKGAGNTNLRSGLALNWTAFDGFAMFAVKERLDLQEQRSQAFTQRAMHDLVSQIENIYYGIVRIRQQVDIREQSIQLNRDLQELAEAKLKIGTGTALQVLQTTNRVNADSSALLNQIDQLNQAKISLNRMMGRDPQTAFDVSPDVPQSLLPTLSELTQLAIQQNHDAKLLEYEEQIALTQIKEARSVLYPQVDLNAGYNYSFSKAEIGFALSNRSYGPTIGIGVSYDIFSGRNIKKDLDNAEIFKQNVLLSKKELEEDLRADLAVRYQDYIALQELLELERRNVTTAEQNTSLARQLYRSGRATNFDVREAILTEIQVKDRLSDVQYRQKVTEIELKRLAGIPLY
ncbi:MAG: TolC family protein [Saprospiraceae bacterium]